MSGQLYARYHYPEQKFANIKFNSTDVELAATLAHDLINEKGVPIAFQFFEYHDFDGYDHGFDQSTIYVLGGEIHTYEMLLLRDDPKEKMVRERMRLEKIDRLIVNKHNDNRPVKIYYKSNIIYLDWEPETNWLTKGLF